MNHFFAGEHVNGYVKSNGLVAIVLTSAIMRTIFTHLKKVVEVEAKDFSNLVHEFGMVVHKWYMADKISQGRKNAIETELKKMGAEFSIMTRTTTIDSLVKDTSLEEPIIDLRHPVYNDDKEAEEAAIQDALEDPEWDYQELAIDALGEYLTGKVTKDYLLGVLFSCKSFESPKDTDRAAYQWIINKL